MAMAAGGVFSGARKEETREGGGYRPGASQAASLKRRVYRSHGMGAKAVGDVRRGSG
jgi:hypothetical protein